MVRLPLPASEPAPWNVYALATVATVTDSGAIAVVRLTENGVVGPAAVSSKRTASPEMKLVALPLFGPTPTTLKFIVPPVSTAVPASQKLSIAPV